MVIEWIISIIELHVMVLEYMNILKNIYGIIILMLCKFGMILLNRIIPTG